MHSRVLSGDIAQPDLVAHLAQTERLMLNALRKIDSKATCEVLPAADLGIPYDALRLSGGFATGCFVQWTCTTPVVPVDITMNIDTSSVFWVDESALEWFCEDSLSRVKLRLETQTSYEWNFDSSNHFIALVREEATNRLAIIVHSNEKEFKNQYHGLCPTDGNWYERDVRVDDSGQIRLLVGRSAEVFSSMAKMLEPFNIVRHEFLIHELMGATGRVLGEAHDHHYYMPTESSAALGCYIVPANHAVPVFSQVGRPILMYSHRAGGPNHVRVEGLEHCIVPHGWGMTLSRPLQLEVSSDSLMFQGRDYERRPGVSLLTDPDVMPRTFASTESFVDAMAGPCPGQVVSSFVQLRSLTRWGFQDFGVKP